MRRRDGHYRQCHAAHLEGHAAGLVDRLLHTVAGDVALDQLVLAHLADLEDEAPLAVNAANHGLVRADDGATARLRVRRRRNRHDGSREARVDDADAERVHEDRLHHFPVEQEEGDGVVA